MMNKLYFYLAVCMLPLWVMAVQAEQFNRHYLKGVNSLFMSRSSKATVYVDSSIGMIDVSHIENPIYDDRDILVSRISDTGKIIWQRLYGQHNGRHEFGYSIALTEDKRYGLIVGRASSQVLAYTQYDDLLVFKIRLEDGQLMWSKTISTDAEDYPEGASNIVRFKGADGNPDHFLISGYARRSRDFSTPISTIRGVIIYLVSINGDGVINWDRIIHTQSFPVFQTSFFVHNAVNDNGEIVIAGNMFIGTLKPLHPFVLKVNSLNGNIIQFRRYVHPGFVDEMNYYVSIAKGVSNNGYILSYTRVPFSTTNPAHVRAGLLKIGNDLDIIHWDREYVLSDDPSKAVGANSVLQNDVLNGYVVGTLQDMLSSSTERSGLMMVSEGGIPISSKIFADSFPFSWYSARIVQGETPEHFIMKSRHLYQSAGTVLQGLSFKNTNLSIVDKQCERGTKMDSGLTSITNHDLVLTAYKWGNPSDYVLDITPIRFDTYDCVGGKIELAQKSQRQRFTDQRASDGDILPKHFQKEDMLVVDQATALQRSERLEIGLIVQPNPFENQFTVEFPADKDEIIERIMVYDLNGKRVETNLDHAGGSEGKQKFLLDGSNLKPGPYFLEVQTNKRRFVENLVKK